MSRAHKDLPLVYSCSGCSSAAQMTNAIAIRLDRQGKAEMSCIAGVGGGVKSLVKKAQSGRPILAIDGCHLQCARHCLEQQGVTPTRHIVLGEAGVKKRYHAEFDPAEADALYPDISRAAEAIKPVREPSQPLSCAARDKALAED